MDVTDLRQTERAVIDGETRFRLPAENTGALMRRTPAH